jgi:hypothetical protein
MKNKKSVAYGTVLMSEGEGFKDAKVQLESFIGHNPVAIFFDVLGKPGDELKGEQLVKQIKDYAEKNFENLNLDDINCTFSID